VYYAAHTKNSLTTHHQTAVLRYTLQVLFDFESKATELLPDAMQSLSFENEYEELEVSSCYHYHLAVALFIDTQH
jgi:hypothetical protein